MLSVVKSTLSRLSRMPNLKPIQNSSDGEPGRYPSGDTDPANAKLFW